MTEAERKTTLAQFTADELITEWARRQDQELETLLAELQADDQTLYPGEQQP